MGTELYRFLIEHNRNNSTKNNLFGPLQIKSLQKCGQNKGDTKQVLIKNGRSGLETRQSFCKSKIYFQVALVLETTL